MPTNLITFDGDTTPALADLDANLQALADMAVVLGGTHGQISLTTSVNASGDNVVTISLDDSVQVATLNVTGSFKGMGTGTGALPAPGYIGSVVSNTQASPGVVLSPSSGVTPAVTVVSMGLTPGNYLVFGNLTFVPNGNNITAMIAAINTLQHQLPNDYYFAEDVRTATVPSANPHIPAMPRILSSSSAFEVDLNAKAICGGNINAFGQLFAIQLP